MSWKELLAPAASTTLWHGLEGYVQTRIDELTGVCVAPESSDLDIRKAQAAIIELQRLLALPESIRAETQIRAQAGARKEY